MISGRDTQLASNNVLLLNLGGRYIGRFHFIITHFIFSLCTIYFNVNKNILFDLKIPYLGI